MYKLYNFDFPDELLQSILPEYYSGLYTTYFNKKLDCGDYYQSIIDNVTKDLGLHHRCRYNNYTWIQVYDEKTGHFLHDHYHPSALFSWVHFINPLETKCFYFNDSYGNKFYPPQQKNNFIVFPSWASHEIDKSPIRGRAVIAGNVFVETIKSSIGLSKYNTIDEKKVIWEIINSK